VVECSYCNGVRANAENLALKLQNSSSNRSPETFQSPPTSGDETDSETVTSDNSDSGSVEPDVQPAVWGSGSRSRRHPKFQKRLHSRSLTLPPEVGVVVPQPR